MRTITTCLLFVSTLAAQTSIVFPSTHQNIADGAQAIYWFPFSSGISRQQIVYEDWDLNIPANTPITRIGFRQDSVGGGAPGRQLQMEVRIGTTTATASSLGTNYDNNFASAPQVVFAQGLYSLPAITASAPGIVWVNFATPYQYPGGNLLVEFKVFANNNGNQAFSYYLDQASYVSPVANGVQGCLHSGNQRPVLTNSPTQVGSNWNLALSSAPSNTAVALLLAPGQPMAAAPYSLQVLGLDPSCQGQLASTGLVAFSGSTNASGGVNWSVPVPSSLAFNNYVISSQVAALDFFVPGSLVVSNASEVQFGIAPPSTILYSQGSASAATGQVYPNYGVVTLFN